MKTKTLIAYGLFACVTSSAVTALILYGNDLAKPQTTVAENPQASTQTTLPTEHESDTLVKNLMREIKQLRTQVNKIETQRDTEKSVPTLVSTKSLDAENLPISQEILDKQRENLVNSHREILENSLRQERADPKWSETARSKLSATYSAAENKGVHFVAADCRSTLCKVDMTLAHPDKRNELQLRSLMDSPTPWRGPRFMQLNKQTGEAVMYMMREDYELPKLPSEN